MTDVQLINSIVVFCLVGATYNLQSFAFLHHLPLRSMCKSIDMPSESFSNVRSRSYYMSSRTIQRSRLLWGTTQSFSRYDENDDDDDDDDYLEIDPDSLKDWRSFRRTLENNINSHQQQEDSNKQFSEMSVLEKATRTTTTATTTATSSGKISKENLSVLKLQNPQLAKEFEATVWAHEIGVPEIGGLVVRTPLEVELFRNHRHSLNGAKLRQQLEIILSKKEGKNDSSKSTKKKEAISIKSRDERDEKKKRRKRRKAMKYENIEPSLWYSRAQTLVEQQMRKIAGKVNRDGEIEASTLSDESAELLQLYLDNQENWQEVGLVIQNEDGYAETLILNRPMSLKLTPNLAQLLLKGTFSNSGTPLPTSSKPSWSTSIITSMNNDNKEISSSTEQMSKERKLMDDFLLAFGSQCGVYVGGPDNQHRRGLMLHGIPDLDGAVELAPGTKLYTGGIEAAIKGVLDGRYSPYEFRFFIGKHIYKSSKLDIAVRLGKYQPMACSRTIPLKQCLSLPKPLWHEVNQLCGGLMKDISELELLKRNDLIQVQVIDDDDDDDDDSNFELLAGDDDDDLYLTDIDIELLDEIEEMEKYTEDDDGEDDFFLYLR